MRIMAFILGATLMISCSVEAKLTLLPAGEIGIDSLVNVKTAAKDAWKNLGDLDPTLPADPMDPGLWRQGLGPRAKIVPSSGGTSVAFVISDPKKLFPDLKTGPGLWDLTLDRANLHRLAALSSWGNSPALDSLLPSPETTVTEAEYRDLLIYLLGPGTAPAAAGVLIDASSVQLTVVAPQPILTAEGAATIQGNQATYRWPLVHILALPAPVHLRLTY